MRCEPREPDLAVSIFGRHADTRCEREVLTASLMEVSATADTVEVELNICPTCERPILCILQVSGLDPNTAQRMTDELSEWGYQQGALVPGFNSAALFLAEARGEPCDPLVDACPLLFAVGMGDLAGEEGATFDFSWDPPECSVSGDPCAPAIHPLAVVSTRPVQVVRLGQGEASDLVSLEHGELVVANSASSSRPCTDEGRLAEWAAWVRPAR
jgi:hypothetical protein